MERTFILRSTEYCFSTAIDAKQYNILFKQWEHSIPLMWAPGFTQSPNKIGVVAIVTVTMTSAPLTASCTEEQTRTGPLTELANFTAFSLVRFHILTFKERKDKLISLENFLLAETEVFQFSVDNCTYITHGSFSPLMFLSYKWLHFMCVQLHLNDCFVMPE